LYTATVILGENHMYSETKQRYIFYSETKTCTIIKN